MGALTNALGLTRQQFRALAFIRSYIAEHGWPPSFEEIGAGIGLKSNGNVHRIINALVERKAVTYLPNRARSLAIPEQPCTEGVDFLPDHLAVWIRVTAARAGVTPLQVVTECVRDGYTNSTGRNGERDIPRETTP